MKTIIKGDFRKYVNVPLKETFLEGESPILNEDELNHTKFSYSCLVDVQTLTAHSLIIDQNLQFLHTVSVKIFPVNFELNLWLDTGQLITRKFWDQILLLILVIEYFLFPNNGFLSFGNLICLKFVIVYFVRIFLDWSN